MYRKVEEIPVGLITLPLKEFNKEYKKWGKIPRSTLMKRRRKLNKKVNKRDLDEALNCVKILQNQANKLYEEKMEAIENYKDLKSILDNLYDNGILVKYYKDRGYRITRKGEKDFKFLDIFNIFNIFK